MQVKTCDVLRVLNALFALFLFSNLRTLIITSANIIKPFAPSAILVNILSPVYIEIISNAQRVINQKFLLNTCKTPFYVLYYIYSRKEEGQKPLYVAYHHLIAVIKVEIAIIASITRYAKSKAVGF